MVKNTQITPFIIVGLVIVISFGLFIYFGVEKSQENEDFEYHVTTGDVNLVKKMTQDCIYSLIDKGIITHGVDGIDSFIDENLEFCTDFEQIPNLNIRTGNVFSDAVLSLDKNNLAVRVNYSITIKNGKTTITVPEFLVEFKMLKTVSIPLESGKVSKDIEIVSNDKNTILKIDKGVIIKDKDGNPVDSITVKIKENNAASHVPLATHVTYDFLPDGATFDPPIEISVKYDDSLIRNGFDERDIRIATTSDGSHWTFLVSNADTLSNTVSAKIRHFSEYAAGFVYQYYQQGSSNEADSKCREWCKNRIGSKNIYGYALNDGCQDAESYYCNENDIRCQCVGIKCTDSDGNDYFNKGEVKATLTYYKGYNINDIDETKEVKFKDDCSSAPGEKDILLEGFCSDASASGNLYTKQVCDEGCSAGKCKGTGTGSSSSSCEQKLKEECKGNCGWVTAEKLKRDTGKCLPSCGHYLASTMSHDGSGGCFETKPEGLICGERVSYEAYSEATQCTYCCQNYKRTSCEDSKTEEECSKVEPSGKCKWVKDKGCLPSCGTWLEKQSYNDIGAGCHEKKPDDARCGQAVSYEAYKGDTKCNFCCENPDAKVFKNGAYVLTELKETKELLSTAGYFTPKGVVAGTYGSNKLYYTDGINVNEAAPNIGGSISSIEWIYSKDNILNIYPQGRNEVYYLDNELKYYSSPDNPYKANNTEDFSFGMIEENTNRQFRGWGEYSKPVVIEEYKGSWEIIVNETVAEIKGRPTSVAMFPNSGSYSENILVALATSEGKSIITEVLNQTLILTDFRVFDIWAKIKGIKSKVYIYGGNEFFELKSMGATPEKIKIDTPIKGAISSIAVHPVTDNIIVAAFSREKDKPLQLFEYDEKERKLIEFYNSTDYGFITADLVPLKNKNTLILATTTKHDTGIFIRIDPAQEGSGVGNNGSEGNKGGNSGGNTGGSKTPDPTIDFCAKTGHDPKYIPRQLQIERWIDRMKKEGKEIDYQGKDCINWAGVDLQDMSADWCEHIGKGSSGSNDCSHFCVDSTQEWRYDHIVDCCNDGYKNHGAIKCGINGRRPSSPYEGPTNTVNPNNPSLTR